MRVKVIIFFCVFIGNIQQNVLMNIERIRIYLLFICLIFYKVQIQMINVLLILIEDLKIKNFSYLLVYKLNCSFFKFFILICYIIIFFGYDLGNQIDNQDRYEELLQSRVLVVKDWRKVNIDSGIVIYVIRKY